MINPRFLYITPICDTKKIGFLKTRKKKALYLSALLIVSILSSCMLFRVLNILRPVVIIKVIKTA